MYEAKIYLEPKDVLDRLSDEDKRRFNRCVFTDVEKAIDGSVNIHCVFFNDADKIQSNTRRVKYISSEIDLSEGR